MFNLIGRALAITNPPTPRQTIPSLVDFLVAPSTDPITTIKKVLGWLLLIAGALAVIYLIYGGILYITAGGDAEKATKGRTALINAIIGIIIIALAFAIVTWVGTLISK